MQFKMTYSDNNCKEFDIIQNDEVIGYYVEHHNHPVELTKLDNTVYEVYYNHDGEEYTCSIVADTLNEALEYAELV